MSVRGQGNWYTCISTCKGQICLHRALSLGHRDVLPYWNNKF